MKCLVCKEGEYKETGIFDDWDGVLHCTHCGHEIKKEDIKTKDEEETEDE